MTITTVELVEHQLKYVNTGKTTDLPVVSRVKQHFTRIHRTTRSKFTNRLGGK